MDLSPSSSNVTGANSLKRTFQFERRNSTKLTANWGLAMTKPGVHRLLGSISNNAPFFGPIVDKPLFLVQFGVLN